jgi:general stress protein 26
MTSWAEFAADAPRIAAVFTRRHRATGNLCLLATLRADGFPRISPMEPHIFADRLWLPGMPDTTKFRDLVRDPRFCLHSATVDTQVSDGDVKLWGLAQVVSDPVVREQFVESLRESTGLDLREERFDLFDTDLT